MTRPPYRCAVDLMIKTDEVSEQGWTDDQYWDLGRTASWSLTKTWNLNGGYKRILGLKDFESNQFFVGMLLRF
jgi:hypothetical protein